MAVIMLALVRIQTCSLLILDCRAVLLPGNYTARAGRQSCLQHTPLREERVFSNFFSPSLSSKSEPARKLWREALVLQVDCLGSCCRTWMPSKLHWVSAVGVHHCRPRMALGHWTLSALQGNLQKPFGDQHIVLNILSCPAHRAFKCAW